jgi:hypothetical protein
MFNKLLTRKGRLEDQIQTELNKELPKTEEIIKIVDAYQLDNVKTIGKLKKEKKVELKRINGALKQSIDAHGPITKVLIGSATKRIYGSMLANYAPKKENKKFPLKPFVIGVVLSTIVDLLVYLLFF